MPKLSVIIPVYNTQQFLPACMDSIFKQTMQDYEVLIIDDGSADESYQKAVSYKERYPDRVRVFHQENAGQGQARNYGIRQATGDFILFVDSDDTLKETMFEETYTAVMQSGADMLIFDADAEDEAGRFIKTIQGCHAQEGVITLEGYPQLLFEYPAPWNKIYKRTLFTEGNLYYPTHMWYEDLVGASIFYTGVRRIAVLHKALYNYIQHPASVMHNKVSPKNIEILKAMDLILNFYRRKGLYEKYKQELEFVAIYHILIAATGRTVRGDYRSDLHVKFLEYMDDTFPDWKNSKYLDRLSKIQKLKLELLRRRKFALLSFLYKFGKKNPI